MYGPFILNKSLLQSGAKKIPQNANFSFIWKTVRLAAQKRTPEDVFKH